MNCAGIFVPSYFDGSTVDDQHLDRTPAGASLAGGCHPFLNRGNTFAIRALGKSEKQGAALQA
jgi:hypothetical protein